MNPLTQSKKTIIRPLLIALGLVCFALSPRAQAVLPAPDGGYPGGNTAEGTNALFSRTSGLYNTATGLNALLKDTSGSRNTANGVNALRSNTTGSSNTAVGTNALFLNSSIHNTAIGDSALFSTQSALGTRPSVINRSSAATSAVSIRPLVISAASTSRAMAMSVSAEGSEVTLA